MSENNVARVNQDKAGSLIISGSTTVFANDKNVAFESSIMAGPKNRGDVIIASPVTVFVENKKIAVQGAVTARGYVVGIASPNVFAGNN